MPMNDEKHAGFSSKYAGFFLVYAYLLNLKPTRIENETDED